jgi:hypothetical protein
MKTTTEHSELESIADAARLLQKEGYIMIDPNAMRRAREGFELRRMMDAEAYRQYMSNPASYNHQ